MMKIRAAESSKRDTPIDRLSALPDSLLLHILSFVGVKGAAITSVLSKRWQFLWADLPRVEVREYRREHLKIRQFVSWVYRALDIRSSNYMEKFGLHFTYYKGYAPDVDAWIEICVNNKVKIVDLVLEPWEGKYILPQMMYFTSSLTCLMVRGCIMSPQRTIEWGSLTKLHLQRVELSRHLFGNILSGCPVLCELILDWCWGLDRLEVYSRSLHALAITDWEGGIHGQESFLEISAPYIQCLEISTSDEKRLRLTNISSLVSVRIRLFGSWNAQSVEQMSYAKELFGSIQHVNKLELRGYCTEILSVLMMNGWRLLESSREHLIVDVSKDDENISVIAELLESSPNLETLVIKGHHYYQKAVIGHRCGTYLKKGDLNCDLSHLKTVNITGFTNSNVVGQPMLILAQILLKRAVVLEKMSIDVRDSDTIPKRASGDYINVAQTLLSYPRSSTKASILLCC